MYGTVTGSPWPATSSSPYAPTWIDQRNRERERKVRLLCVGETNGPISAVRWLLVVPPRISTTVVTLGGTEAAPTGLASACASVRLLAHEQFRRPRDRRGRRASATKSRGEQARHRVHGLGEQEGFQDSWRATIQISRLRCTQGSTSCRRVQPPTLENVTAQCIAQPAQSWQQQWR